MTTEIYQYARIEQVNLIFDNATGPVTSGYFVTRPDVESYLIEPVGTVTAQLEYSDDLVTWATNDLPAMPSPVTLSGGKMRWDNGPVGGKLPMPVSYIETAKLIVNDGKKFSRIKLLTGTATIKHVISNTVRLRVDPSDIIPD